MATTRALMYMMRISARQQMGFRCSTFYSTTSSTNVQSANMADPKSFEDIPGPGGLYKLPVIGALLHFKPFTDITAATSQKLLDGLIDKFGPVVKIQIGQQGILVSDPKDVDTVFKNEGKYPVRPPTDISVIYTKRNNRIPSIVDLQGEEWHRLRGIFNKRFMKVNSALYYLKPQNVVADEFIHILTTQKLSAKELSDLFFRYTSESIGVVCFNARLGFLAPELDQESREFLRASNAVFEYLHQSISGESVAHKWYRNKTYRGYENARIILRENSLKHVLEAKAEIEARRKMGTLDPDEPNLLLSLLSDTSLSEEELVSAVETLYVAGTDSTAKNMQSLFYNLATNPDKQAKLHEEVVSLIGPDGPVTAEAIKQMKYLRACLKESFRLLYPTISGTIRILPVDVVLSGYQVPAGTRIMMHNPKSCKDYFVNADKFIPERWLRELEGYRPEEVPATAVLPFGHGPRNCIGRRFAEQEIYLGVIKVLQKFKIDLEQESQKTNFIYTLFVQPEKPLQFRFTDLTKKI